MPELITFDSLVAPNSLDGSAGSNRGKGHMQIAAQEDRAAILAWLARYADSPATLASYRKESERLLMWCVLQHRVALSSLTHEDLLVYQHFLANPSPQAMWVIAPGQKPARHSPLWRPFAGPLSPQSVRQALSIINSLFNWLVAAGYLAGNPLALARRQRNHRAPRVTRFLPMDHWKAVRTTIETLPHETGRKRAQAARVRWLFSLLYIAGLRVSEVCDTTMAGFFSRRGADGKERWWLEVKGKGGKTRLIPATTELMGELMQYRRSLGLPALCAHDETTPLVLPLHKPVKPMARTALHEIVKSVMRGTADRLRKSGNPEDAAAAAHIEQASTHWMRHTAGSHLSNQVDIKVVRDNLGHSNISTTNTYVHAEDDARHDATSGAHRAGWTVK
ncbi:tyrosine-type recombinase/integrase [Paucibacter sp. KCTC 42545]|uniref:tyrosine-type recombinase/integrase n=1 Tax=Paucibacter sp. KCTC 42545 TaxID=1768242 RepID=UPI000733C159|nr:tyrosine-type recombinase/integrase [Paucibacter sp. KCTC 42545]ALT77162.1 integrase [Paucibacter sp. KCTC 42545]